MSQQQDPFDLARFMSAQEDCYETALAELKSGRKRSHWMWYVFPQIDGLGSSSTTRRYAIKSIEEAKQYLKHAVLGPRLIECTDLVLALDCKSISDVFPHPDDLKLQSSMTLFETVGGSGFGRVLWKHFIGKRDESTLRILASLDRDRDRDRDPDRDGDHDHDRDRDRPT